MDTKRLFIGTKINSSIFEYVYDEIQNDFKYASFGKWVEIENLHFTYKFLGDTEINIIPKLKESLSDVFHNYDSVLQLKGIGAFPDLRKPRVLYAKINYSDKILDNIAKNIENIVSKFGFEPENRPFKPHLTLQRIKSFDKSIITETINKYKDFDFGSMSNFTINLIESILTNKGPIYKVL